MDFSVAKCSFLLVFQWLYQSLLPEIIRQLRQNNAVICRKAWKIARTSKRSLRRAELGDNSVWLHHYSLKQKKKYPPRLLSLFLCCRPLQRQGAAAAFSSRLRLKSGSLRAPAPSRGEAQEDGGWISRPLEDCHPPADPTAAHGKRKPEAGGWVKEIWLSPQNVPHPWSLLKCVGLIGSSSPDDTSRSSYSNLPEALHVAEHSYTLTHTDTLKSAGRRASIEITGIDN